MPLELGQRVRLHNTLEVGVVVWRWHEKTIDMNDYIVCFFGEEWPSEQERPPRTYLLRYTETSLEPLDG